MPPTPPQQVNRLCSVWAVNEPFTSKVQPDFPSATRLPSRPSEGAALDQKPLFESFVCTTQAFDFSSVAVPGLWLLAFPAALHRIDGQLWRDLSVPVRRRLLGACSSSLSPHRHVARAGHVRFIHAREVTSGATRIWRTACRCAGDNPLISRTVGHHPAVRAPQRLDDVLAV